MTTARVALVDVYVLRGRGEALEVLVLRRGRSQVRGDSWEAVHGRIESGETPVAAALRELREEIGCGPLALYNLSRVEQFYRPPPEDEVLLIPVFVAFLAADAVIHLNEEHDTLLWLPPAEARQRLSWPRARRALDDAVALLGGGDADVLEDVLRI